VSSEKQAVHDFWDRESCGEAAFLAASDQVGYRAQSRERYRVEPYIAEFAQFHRYRGKRVLEIGVGLGADHQEFAEAGAQLWGIDLTPRAVDHTRRRLTLLGLQSELSEGDAENLPFEDGWFDLVYSWGVLHHTPQTARAIAEVHRVLKPGGEAKIMIYHRYSFVGYFLWVRYALLRLAPWTSLDRIYAQYLESPGTKAYSVPAAKALFHQFSAVDIDIVLSPGDLLLPHTGQRHRGLLLQLAQTLWPRRLIQRVFPGQGLFMLIRAIR